MSASDPSPESKLKHADLEKFVVDTLSKREPCPAMVLAWGWLMKQVRRGAAKRGAAAAAAARAPDRGREAALGRARAHAPLAHRRFAAAPHRALLPRTLQGEGGLFHGDSYKQRFFVLARVPHASECADEQSGARQLPSRALRPGRRGPARISSPPVPPRLRRSPFSSSRAHLLRREDDGRGEHPRCARALACAGARLGRRRRRLPPPPFLPPRAAARSQASLTCAKCRRCERA